MIASFGIGAVALGLGDRFQHPLVVARHHLDEVLAARRPSRPGCAGRQRSRWRRRAPAIMPCSHSRSSSSSASSSTISELRLASNASSRVVDVGDTAGHARREVAAGAAENHDLAAGHVLAAVIADAFDHRVGAGVAHGEPLTDHAAQECLAAGGAEQDHVAADDVVFGHVVRRRVVAAAAPRSGHRTVPCRRSRWRRRTPAA